MAIEGCGEAWQRPCLLLSIDGFLTLQIPKSRKVVGIFLPSVEAEIPAQEKERIGRVYQGLEWRALARGRSRTWHAVADAPSEEAAIAGAMKSCANADSECRLYAIGNFRVAEE